MLAICSSVLFIVQSQSGIQIADQLTIGSIIFLVILFILMGVVTLGLTTTFDDDIEKHIDDDDVEGDKFLALFKGFRNGSTGLIIIFLPVLIAAYFIFGFSFVFLASLFMLISSFSFCVYSYFRFKANLSKISSDDQDDLELGG